MLICFVVVEEMVRGLLCLHANAGALAKELSRTFKLRICCRVCFIRGMVASYIVFLLAGPVTGWMRAPGAVEWRDEVHYCRHGDILMSVRFQVFANVLGHQQFHGSISWVNEAGGGTDHSQ